MSDIKELQTDKKPHETLKPLSLFDDLGDDEQKNSFKISSVDSHNKCKIECNQSGKMELERNKIEANYKIAKMKALEIIERFGFDYPSIDPIEICQELGINVRFVKFSAENSKISGFFYEKRNEIYVNEDDDVYRQIFTIAHELGHKLLHEQWLQTDQYQVLWRDSSLIDSKDIKEIEANCFAANLLVPRHMLKNYYQIANIEELSVLFGVSRQVISFRLKNEGFTLSRSIHD